MTNATVAVLEQILNDNMTAADDDHEALVFDTYELAVELAELAASIWASDHPFELIGIATPGLNAACGGS